MEKIWDSVWEKDAYALEKVRNNKALKKFNIYEQMGVNFKKYKNVGDFGAGGGYMSLELLKRYNNIEKITLFDYSQDALTKAKQNLSLYNNVTYKKYDLNIAINPPKNKFDFIMAFSVLEHVKNFETGLNGVCQASCRI